MGQKRRRKKEKSSGVYRFLRDPGGHTSRCAESILRKVLYPLPKDGGQTPAQIGRKHTAHTPALLCVRCLSCYGSPPQERYDDAEVLSSQAEATVVAAVGENHPNVATILNNRATMFMAQVHSDQVSGVLKTFQHTYVHIVCQYRLPTVETLFEVAFAWID